MIIVSLMEYHMLVNTAIINTVSTVTVGLIIIRKPYAHAGMLISNIMVTTVTNAKVLGETDFLMVANENIM